MTIGIAAFGPNAGNAIVRALAAIEAVGRGAIGGFVSLVAITPLGEIARAETQRGGTSGLYPGGIDDMPAIIAEARIAGLISSGPDRPEPLRQFTPADPETGLVTGHRLPNANGAAGMPLNVEVLSLMREGLSPQDAVERVTAANPEVDAGILALAVDGRVYAADTAHVRKRGDRGQVIAGSVAQGAVAAALHNAIRPHRPIAALAAEIALDAMQPQDRPDAWITFRQGTPLVAGSSSGVNIGADGSVDCVLVDDRKFLTGSWCLGVGFEAKVFRHSKAVAVMIYEPFMIVEDGTLRSIDGRAELPVPIRRPQGWPSAS